MSLRGDWGDKSITYLPTDGKRRHKSRCEHYNHENKKCLLSGEMCFGSAHCDNYKSAHAESGEKYEHHKEHDIVPRPDDYYYPPELLSVDPPKLIYGDPPKPTCIDPPKPICVDPTQEYLIRPAFYDIIPGHFPSFGERLARKTVLIRTALGVFVGRVTQEDYGYIITELKSGEIKKFERRTAIRRHTFYVPDDIRDAKEENLEQAKELWGYDF